MAEINSPLRFRDDPAADEPAVSLEAFLDQADALCTEGKFAEASATLATVNKLVGNSN